MTQESFWCWQTDEVKLLSYADSGRIEVAYRLSINLPPLVWHCSQ